MRVLHVTPCYPPTWAYGGVPRVVYALARAQAAAGLDVRVWTTDAFDEKGRAEVAPRRVEDQVDVRVTRLGSNRLAWHHQLYLPTSMPPLDGVDVVHLHAHRHLLNFLAFRGARARGLPVIHTPNGTLPRIERKVAVKAVWDAIFDGDVPRRADRVVAVSKAEVRQLLAAGVGADRVARIPNPVHLDELAARPPRGTFRAARGLGEGQLVVYLGQISPRKGVDRLVDAFAGGALAPARLVVAGTARGMAPPGGEGVTYTGTLGGEERLALLVDADVVVYPSADEVFGLVPFEGLWCGAPVVVGDDCGCGELVVEAGAGLLAPHGDVVALRAAIRQVLGDGAAAAAMVARGRRYIEAHLSPARVAAAHAALYESVCPR